MHPTFPPVRREEVFLFSFLHMCTISSISYIFQICMSRGSFLSECRGTSASPILKEKIGQKLYLCHTLFYLFSSFSPPFIAKLLKKIVYIYWVHFFPFFTPEPSCSECEGDSHFLIFVQPLALKSIIFFLRESFLLASLCCPISWSFFMCY